MSNSNSIQTYTGKMFNPFEPDPALIDIRDIAHALSHQCRFSGHVSRFYSVAQHCYLASLYAPKEFRLHALLHDASEAYVVDIPSPIKKHPDLWHYRRLEAGVMLAIADRFGIDRGFEHNPFIHVVDTRLCATEARDLMTPWHPELVAKWEALGKPYGQTIVPRTSFQAKRMFIRRFHELTKELEP